MSLISLIRNIECPNFDQNEIPVEFLVVHYTACTLERTVQIFRDKQRKVCSHFIIDTDGSIYDLGYFWNGHIRRGAHAGVSRLELDGNTYEKFNDFSIGVELVNFNGNLIEFPQGQYHSLAKMIKHLNRRFVLLNDPKRIVGHEHIAGFRGKVDPGLCFDWNKLYSMAFPNEKAPDRQAILTQDLLKKFEAINGAIDLKTTDEKQWETLNLRLEKFIAENKV